jgi:hypothetical protein
MLRSDFLCRLTCGLRILGSSLIPWVILDPSRGYMVCRLQLHVPFLTLLFFATLSLVVSNHGSRMAPFHTLIINEMILDFCVLRAIAARGFVILLMGIALRLS